MTTESYRPKVGGSQYRRKRKYVMKDGKRKAIYEAYLGKVGTDTGAALAQSEATLNTLHAELKEFRDLGQDAPKELEKRAAREAKKRDLLELQVIEDAKGSKLTKLEKGIINKLGAVDYPQVNELLEIHVDKLYKAGYGLKALSTSLKEDGIEVSQNTVKSYLIDKGIYEKRKFGHERKETAQEIELQKRIAELERENESLKVTIGVT